MIAHGGHPESNSGPSEALPKEKVPDRSFKEYVQPVELYNVLNSRKVGDWSASQNSMQICLSSAFMKPLRDCILCLCSPFSCEDASHTAKGCQLPRPLPPD